MSSRRVVALAAGVLMLAACVREPASHVDAAADPSRDAAKPTSTASTPAHAAKPPAALDWTLPGEFAPDTTVEQLRARFGNDNVRIVDDLPMAEGETTRGVILFADDPQRRARLYFQDAQTLRGLQMVAVADAQSRWHFADGLRLGMTLDEMVRANGKPVGFSGLDWDYGGYAGEWNGGRFARCPPPAHCSRSVGLAAAEDTPADAYPIGEGMYSSDDARWPKVGQLLRASELLLMLPGQDDL